MADYRTDREFSDRILPQIKQIVGPRLLEPAPLERDWHEATDMIVLRARDMCIGARVRRPGYAERYPYEFTIRARRDSGAVTELSKIVEGWGDWLFYGHVDDNELIHLWWLIDLHAFRAALIRCQKQIKSGDKPNGDGTFFKWFDVRSFPAKPALLIASSRPLLETEYDAQDDFAKIGD